MAIGNLSAGPDESSLPDTATTSIQFERKTEVVWVYEGDEMVLRPISYIPALYNMFNRLFSAADKYSSVKVKIDVQENYISVCTSGGDVEILPEEDAGAYVREKLATEFVIEMANGRGRYKQVFPNAIKKSEFNSTDCNDEYWRKVTFKPDLAKFNMAHLEDDVVALMKRRVVDLAGCFGKTVTFELNDVVVPVKSFFECVDLYLQSASKSRPASLPRIAERVNDRWEICVSLSEGQFQQVSFVNGIATAGETHVDYVTDEITKHVTKIVNKKNKNATDVKNHLWIFVNALIDNPRVNPQYKETLSLLTRKKRKETVTLLQSSSVCTSELNKKLLRKLSTSEVVKSLLSRINSKQRNDLKKTDGAKAERITGIAKLVDAENAGGAKSSECILILTEGDSAKSFTVSSLSVVDDSDKYGVYALIGKSINGKTACPDRVYNNTELKDIKKILGLEDDRVYDTVDSLRYGQVMIMADQDDDGTHIRGLVLNIFHTFWPSLLKIPSFLVDFVTPILKAKGRDECVKSFFTIGAYESWHKTLSNPDEWQIKYYKGLGTSTHEEGKQYFRNLNNHLREFVWINHEDGDALNLAYGRDNSENRKKWILQYQGNGYSDLNEKKIRIKDFVYKDLASFAIANCQRSIASMLDGLKPTQRKILIGAFQKNLSEKSEKVSVLAGHVAGNLAYHHGVESLYETIIAMAQGYVGRNNLSLLAPTGQFGTRQQGGKDSAHARYLNTELPPITRILFTKEDDRLLKYLEVEGKQVEPIWYIPVIPLVLVNGSNGIGTGWRSTIPMYNPRDIVANVELMMNNQRMKAMIPWYRGFTGTIEKGSSANYVVTGTIVKVNDNTIWITEIPLGRTLESYFNFLKSKIDEEHTFVKGCFKKNTNPAVVYFEINLFDGYWKKKPDLLAEFKLRGTIHTSCMYLFNAKGILTKYGSPEQIIEEFYPIRLDFYGKRLGTSLKEKETELKKIDNKVRFMSCIREGTIKPYGNSELLLQLAQKGFAPFPKKAATLEEDYGYLLSITSGDMTREKVDELCAVRDELRKSLDQLRLETPISLWKQDLALLKTALKDQDEIVTDEEIERGKLQEHVEALKKR